MRIIIGTERGVRTARWVRGERSAQLRAAALEARCVVAVTAGEAIRNFGRPGRKSGPLYAAARAPAGGKSRTIEEGAATDAGIFRTDDRGDTWHPFAPPPAGDPGAALHTLAADGEGRLYAGTGPPGVFTSAEDGGDWRDLEAFRALEASETWRGPDGGHAHVRTITCDPHDERHLFVGVEVGGAYRSDDGGRNWAAVNDGLSGDVHALIVDPVDGARVFAATGGGLEIGEARGERWRRAPGEPGGAYCTALAVLGGPGVSRPVLCVATAAGPPSTWKRLAGDARARLWLSRDRGASWSELREPPTRTGRSGYVALAADPTQEAAVFAGTADGHLYHVEDEGGRWTRLLYGLPPICAILAV